MYDFDPLTECWCDGGGSIRHVPSLKCTMHHPHLEVEYEKQRIAYEVQKAVREAFPKPTIQNREAVDDNF